jgi:putative DeoR family transcriptional regulator (stage III sporulation protein D)
LKGLPEERAISLAQHIIENNATVRQTAKKFNISKSTVHKDVSERLRTLNESLYRQVKLVLEQNKSERHIRGGRATKTKYERLRQR